MPVEPPASKASLTTRCRAGSGLLFDSKLNDATAMPDPRSAPRPGADQRLYLRVIRPEQRKTQARALDAPGEPLHPLLPQRKRATCFGQSGSLGWSSIRSHSLGIRRTMQRNTCSTVMRDCVAIRTGRYAVSPICSKLIGSVFRLWMFACAAAEPCDDWSDANSAALVRLLDE